MDAFSTGFTRNFLAAVQMISRLEEASLRRTDCVELSRSELQLISELDESPKTVSTLAALMGVTTPSMTVTVQKLTRQKYVEKKRCEEDKRVVFVHLTENGKRVATMFRFLHENMARSVAKMFTEEEKEAFSTGLTKLNRFLNQELSKMEEKE